MADVRGFRGFRYDLGRVGSLSDVVAPPYDVIDKTLQQKLYDLSEHNAIRLELTKDEPGDDETENKLHPRREHPPQLDRRERTPARHESRSLYIYEQDLRRPRGQDVHPPGVLRPRPPRTVRQGPASYAHEQTMSGPKADRLKLYRATGFQLSPVFSLYPDPENEVARVFEPFTRNQPPLVAKDHLGVTNRLWVITDSHAVSTVIGLMGPKPVFIADGHHRYETGLKYLEERKELGEVQDDEAAPHFCLMLLVGMSDPGLIILPTHRLLSGLGAVTSDELKSLLAPGFDVVESFGADATACWEHIQMDGAQSVLGFGTVADGQWFVAKLRDPAAMAKLAPEQSEEWRELGVSILQKLVLGALLKSRAEQPTIQYVHLMKEVTDAVAAKSCGVAVLVPPATMDHVEGIAGNRETMPAKSTYFFPKVLTGVVFNSLKKD